jgi:predicted transcriptional regulator
MKRFREKTKEERLRFAQMLDELKADGMTQKDFASVMGISQACVSPA